MKPTKDPVNLWHWLDANFSHLLEEYLQQGHGDGSALGCWLIDWYPDVLKMWFDERN